MSLYGLILAGGKSTRMGFDKSKLNFHGVDQVQYLHTLLSNYCEHVFVSGDSQNIKGDYQFIEDSYDRGGPLNGILSAFKFREDVSWLVVAVDMPNINQDAIQLLIQNSSDQSIATCFKDSKGFIEPLPVLLNASSYLPLINYFNKNLDSLHKFLQESNSQVINALDSNWLKNINNPSQL